MNFTPMAIPEIVIIEPQVFEDDRGFFMETWQARKFSDCQLDLSFVQENHILSKRGALRGLHYQVGRPQGKLARVVRGEVYDVAVDVRRDSPTFGQWVGVYMSARERTSLWIPEGFAHGFYALSDEAEFIYKCTEFFAPEMERCIAWNDPDLAIDWPLSKGGDPILSAKDAAAGPFRDAELFE